MDFTGNPLFDVGLAALTVMADKPSPGDLTSDELDAAAGWITENYPQPPLRSYLSMAFTVNGWFIQEHANPDKPGLNAVQREKRQQKRDELVHAHLYQWQHPGNDAERCHFTGLPVATLPLSVRLPPGRAGRALAVGSQLRAG